MWSRDAFACSCGSSRERILYLLKTKGPSTAAELARRLEITPMGARQHLQQLEAQELVGYDEERSGVGRPRRVWRLTAAANGRFPDGYADLTALTEGIEAQIADGDYVVIREQRHASKGEMVVARTPEGEATLKYWFPESNRIRLQPANSEMDPIYVKDAQVIGVVVGVVRQM